MGLESQTLCADDMAWPGGLYTWPKTGKTWLSVPSTYFTVVVFVYCRLLKFYTTASGKLTMVVNGVISNLTPWPVNKAQLRQDHQRKTVFVLGGKGFD